mmetsp:Transcript_5503/g.24445  ORF Transcript_5503/g.24445 Transcript_5503/m.24445 type:complete len:201 (+) Transcript_5503:786-1388(+)
MAIGTSTFTGKEAPWSLRQYWIRRLALLRCLFACDITSRMGSRSSTLIGNSSASQHLAVTRLGFSSLPSFFLRARSIFHFCLAVRGGGAGAGGAGGRFGLCRVLPGPAVVGRSGGGSGGFPTPAPSSSTAPSSSFFSRVFASSASSDSSDSASSRLFTRRSTIMSAAPSLNDARYSENVPFTLYAPFRVTFLLAILPDAS